uniref:Putative general substrate transporter n=1 Tax=Moniliophthora roreri TaxID=221103 RepID=A0A0W0FTN9_MONRR
MRGITIACGSRFMLFGYVQGVLGGLLTGAPFQARFPELTTNSTLQCTTVAIYEIGCAFGIFFWGEKLGRRRGIVLGMAVLTVGAILQFMSYSLGQLIVGRIVTGLGNGMTMSTIPVWHSETSMSHNRGRNVCIGLGVNMSCLPIGAVDYGLRNNQTGYQWRFPLALQVVFAVVTIFFVCFLPESPRWLASQDRVDEARDVIYMLETLEGDARVKATGIRLESTSKAIRIERAAGASSFRNCLRNGEQMMQQVSGIKWGLSFCSQAHHAHLFPAVLSHIMLDNSSNPTDSSSDERLSSFKKSVGLSRDMSLLLSGFNGLAYFFSSLVPIPFIERLGRRKLVLFGAVGMSLTMALLTAMTEDTNDFEKGIVTSVCLFSSVGWLAIPWLYPAEIASLQIRAKAAALSMAANWLVHTYIVWACTNFVFIPIIYFFYAETTGQTLEDIDLLFEGEKPWILGPSSARRAAMIRAKRRADEVAKIKGVYVSSDSDEKIGADNHMNLFTTMVIFTNGVYVYSSLMYDFLKRAIVKPDAIR